MKKWYLLVSSLFVFSFANAQITFSANEKGELVCNGTIDFQDKSEKEVFDCIIERDFIKSIQKHSKKRDQTTFVQGEYQYNYYAIDEVTPIGEISFEYNYTIKKGILAYTFYNFKHHKGNSNIESLGVLPFKMDDHFKTVFSEEQYSKTLFSQKFNISHWINMLKKYCLN